MAEPDHTPVELLTRAVTDADGVVSEDLLEQIVTRLILTLVQADEQAEALVVYDRYRERFEMAGLVREELERSQIQKLLASGRIASRSATIRLAIADPAPDSELLLSSAPADDNEDARTHAREQYLRRDMFKLHFQIRNVLYDRPEIILDERSFPVEGINFFRRILAMNQKWHSELVEEEERAQIHSARGAFSVTL